MNHLFSTEGHFLNALSDLATIVFLNIFTILCCIPIVTAGAAYTSMHFCIMKMVEGDTHILRLFWKQFRLNLKDVTVLWIIMLLLGAFIGFDYWIVFQQTSGTKNILFVLLTLFAIVYFGLFVWVFPISARFSYSAGAALHNAAILAVARFPRTLAMMVITAAIPALLLLNLRLYPILFFLGLSLPAYLSQFFYSGVIQKMLKEKLGITDEEEVSENPDEEQQKETERSGR